MLELLIVVVRGLALMLRGHRELVLENAALRRSRPRSQTWRTFLTNHLASAAAVDFFTVPTLTGRVLFVLVVLSHCRRRIVHFNVTDHPTATWAAQQVVDAFPDDTVPKWLHRDRDTIYIGRFR